MRWDVVTGNTELFVVGMGVTLLASLLSLAFSMALGVVAAVLRIQPIRPLSVAARVYIEVFQNIPHLVVILFCFYGLPQLGWSISAFNAGVLGLSFYSSAFMAEALRSGVLAVDANQWRSARASGFSYLATVRHVVLPQAITYALPPLTNQWVRVVKNTSILAVIAGGDLLYHANRVAAQTFAVFEVYLLIALVYLALTIPLSRLSQLVEHRIAWRSAMLSRAR